MPCPVEGRRFGGNRKVEKLFNQALFVPRQKVFSASYEDVTTSSGELVAADASRKYLLIENIGANNVYIDFAAGTASSTNGLTLAPGKAIELDKTVHTGAITAIADTATTKVAVIEG